MTLRIDRRVRRFTPANVTRMLQRKRVTADSAVKHNGDHIVLAIPITPAQRQLLAALSFSCSRAHGYWYRTWKPEEVR